MNKKEFKKALDIAHSHKELPGYLSVEMEGAIGGCALDNRRRFVRIDHVASMIRGHCMTYAGTWNYSELDNIQFLAKRFDIIGE